MSSTRRRFGQEFTDEQCREVIGSSTPIQAVAAEYGGGSAWMDTFGVDAVDAGPLAEGWRFHCDTPAPGTAFTTATLPRTPAPATR